MSFFTPAKPKAKVEEKPEEKPKPRQAPGMFDIFTGPAKPKAPKVEEKPKVEPKAVAKPKAKAKAEEKPEEKPKPKQAPGMFDIFTGPAKPKAPAQPKVEEKPKVEPKAVAKPKAKAKVEEKPVEKPKPKQAPGIFDIFAGPAKPKAPAQPKVEEKPKVEPKVVAKPKAQAIQPSNLPGKKRVVVVIVGPPGSGKSTHAPRIAQRLGGVRLSIGDIVREAVAKKTPAGLVAVTMLTQSISNLYSLSDGVLMSIVADRIDQPDCSKGFVLDGFPSTVKQAELLDTFLGKTNEKVNRVIVLSAEDNVLEDRIKGRWIHGPSGRVYHDRFKTPRSLGTFGVKATAETMKDDVTGETLERTFQNTPATKLADLVKRGKNDSQPVITYYKDRVRQVNANQSVNVVWGDVNRVLPAGLNQGVFGAFEDCFSGVGACVSMLLPCS